MKRAVMLSVVTVVCLQGLVLADGCMMPDENWWRQHRERSLINEPEQKAVVFFSKGTEQLIISPSYEGPTSKFAWVIPVPARPKVEILKGALFHELAALTMPRPPLHKGRAADKMAAAAPPPKVRVLERKTVGAYDVSVLEATDPTALMDWLKANKYHMPSKAVEPMHHYVDNKWTFVACRVKVPHNAKGLKTGTLAPLRLTFKAKSPIYPLRLSSANPNTFHLLVYLIAPQEVFGHDQTIGQLTGPVGGPKWRRSVPVPAGQTTYPTLAKLSRQALSINVTNATHRTVDPRECGEDMVWHFGE